MHICVYVYIYANVFLILQVQVSGSNFLPGDRRQREFKISGDDAPILDLGGLHLDQYMLSSCIAVGSSTTPCSDNPAKML